MKIFDATKLKKKNKNAILLGTGSSINDIDEEFYKFLKESFDIWAINNFYLHKFIVPDFLHFEIKADINGEIFPKVLKKKEDHYKNVIFISDIATRERDLPYKFLDTSVFENFYSYKRIDRLDKNGNYKIDGLYKPLSDIVQITQGKSNSKILDLMVRMKYEKIYFSGIDLSNCKYFWTDNELYKDVSIPEKMKWCGKGRTLGGKPAEFKKEDNHPAHQLATFFNEFLNFNNVMGYNTSVNSLLTNHMPTIKIKNLYESKK